MGDLLKNLNNGAPFTANEQGEVWGADGLLCECFFVPDAQALADVLNEAAKK